jgi:hypothetical protein
MYYVDMPAVRAAIRKLRSEADVVKRHLDQIATTLDDAAPVSWSSPAANTFIDVKPKLTKANGDMIAAIGAIADRMEYAMNNYHQTETANYYTFAGTP